MKMVKKMANHYYCDLDKNNELWLFYYKKINGKMVKKTITNDRDYIIDVITGFSRANSLIKFGDSSLTFKEMTSGEIFTIRNAELILQDYDFKEILENIKDIIAHNGYIIAKPNVNRKPKRKNQTNEIVKKAVIIVLGASLTLGALAALVNSINKKNNKKDTLFIDDESFVKVAYTDNDLTNTLKISNVIPESVEVEFLDVMPEESINLEEKNIEQIPEILEEPKREADKEYIIRFDFPDYSNTEKAEKTKQYYELFERISPLYGIDQNLTLPQATEEGTTHKTGVNAGGAIGLMQIQKSVWVRDNLNLEYYELNPETNEFERHVLNKITEDMCNDLETNVRISCIILQIYLRYYNYNLSLALYAYNMGPTALDKVIKMYCANTGKTRNEVINNPNDLGWMNYCKHPYLERVNEWSDENVFNLTDVRNGEVISYQYTNDNEEAIHR